MGEGAYHLDCEVKEGAWNLFRATDVEITYMFLKWSINHTMGSASLDFGLS